MSNPIETIVEYAAMHLQAHETELPVTPEHLEAEYVRLAVSILKPAFETAADRGLTVWDVLVGLSLPVGEE